MRFAAPKLLAVLSIILLTGCDWTHGTGTDAACLIFGPITFSQSQDSQQTVKEIREHNAAWDELCS